MNKIKFSQKTINIISYVMCGILLCMIAFLCFYKLGIKYVDPWDEARHGVNAYEMLQKGNLFQNTYLYEPDYYNLKPPLSMWCQMLSFLVLGASPFSLRFYSGICYLALAAICAGFVWKRYGRLEAVLTLALLGVNTTPFAAHMIRAGDADSLYVLLFSLAMLFMIQIPDKQSNLYFCGLFFSLAFLTKSYHAGIIAVIGGLFLIISGELKKMKPKTWAVFIVSCVVPILIWAIPRGFADGLSFFKEMLLTDVLGRTDGTLQNNQQPFGWYASYYLGTMSGKLTIYLWAVVVVVAGLFVLSVGKNKEELKAYKNDLLAYSLWILIPFVAFSAVSNKLLWYLYPVTIPLFISMAIVIAKLLKDKRIMTGLKMFAAVLTVICVFIYGKDVYTTIQNQTAVEGNDFQNLVKEASQKVRAEYGEDAVVYAGVIYGIDDSQIPDNNWAGQDVFVAEAYGNLVCKNNLEELQSADDDTVRLLFISKEYLAILSDYAILENYEKYDESAENIVYICR